MCDIVSYMETLRVNSYLKPMKHSDVLISESFLPRLDVGNLQIATNCPDKPIFWKTFIPCPGNRRFDDISLVTANTPDVIECFKRSDGKFERGKKTKKKRKKMKCKQNWRNSFVRSIFKKKKTDDIRYTYFLHSTNRNIKKTRVIFRIFDSSHSKNFLFQEIIGYIFLWINCQLVIIA